MKRCLCAVLLLWSAMLMAQTSVATVDSVRFRNFGIASGLSQITARALLQDEQGFLWIGTQDGLNRFDGYSFRVYYRDRRAAASLGDSHITALARADGGALWVGTMAGGLSRLDPATDQIQVYRHHAEAPDSLAADGIERRLESVSRSVTRADHRTEVLRVAALVAQVSGGVSEQERAVMERLAGVLGLASADVDQAVADALAVLAL